MLAGGCTRTHTETMMDVPVAPGARLWLQFCLVNSISLLLSNPPFTD